VPQTQSEEFSSPTCRGVFRKSEPVGKSRSTPSPTVQASGEGTGPRRGAVQGGPSIHIRARLGVATSPILRPRSARGCGIVCRVGVGRVEVPQTHSEELSSPTCRGVFRKAEPAGMSRPTPSPTPQALGGGAHRLLHRASAGRGPRRAFDQYQGAPRRSDVPRSQAKEGRAGSLEEAMGPFSHVA
jgi:hypothetical protein